MPPCCVIVCLILGLAGMIVFCVGFAMPYWAMVDDGSYHGIWQQTECPTSNLCFTTYIGFGVTPAFEAGRVFSCATIAMSAVAFIFNVITVKCPIRRWAIRTSAMWAMTAMFNLLEAVLIGVTEQKTLDKLALNGLEDYSGMAWGYWMTLASLGIFIILSITLGIVSCTDEVYQEKEETLVTKEKKSKKMSPGRRYMTESGASSMITDKAFAAPSVSTYQPPKNSHPLRYGNGYIMQQPASVNIDNQKKTQLNALDATHYITPPVQDDYSTMGSGKFILNHPTIAPRVDRFTQPGTSISVMRHGEAHQDNVYSFNVTSSGIAVPNRSAPTGYGQNYGQGSPRQNLQVAASPTHTLTLSGEGGPPGYSTLPSTQQPNVSYIPNSSRIYPNIN